MDTASFQMPCRKNKQASFLNKGFFFFEDEYFCADGFCHKTLATSHFEAENGAYIKNSLYFFYRANWRKENEKINIKLEGKTNQQTISCVGNGFAAL